MSISGISSRGKSQMVHEGPGCLGEAIGNRVSRFAGLPAGPWAGWPETLRPQINGVPSLGGPAILLEE